MKVIVEGDVYILPSEDVFENLTGKKKATKNKNKSSVLDDEVLNKKTPHIESKTIVMNEYSVEGAMKFFDELHERAMEASEKQLGIQRDFLLDCAANYKNAALETRKVLVRVEEWEKKHGEGTVPVTRDLDATRSRSPYDKFTEMLASAVSKMQGKKS